MGRDGVMFSVCPPVCVRGPGPGILRGGALKMQDQKMQDLKMKDQMS